MTVNTEVLLDKLYNLRGSDSEILREMDRQKNKAEETKNKTTEEKGKLQSDIAELKKQREELEEQGERFKEVLQGIHKEDYETVLKRLKIDFDPNSILEKLEKNLPKTIENVEKDTKEAEEKLIKVEEEMNEAITTIEELGIRKDTALANQDKLNEYVEMALSSRMNITRDSITSLLSEFGFNEEEQRETAKLLMFPEDALFAYDEKVSVKDKAGKTISEVIQEAKSYEEEELTIPEEPQEKEEQETAKALKEEEIVKEQLIELLKEYGIDYLDYTSEEIEELLENFDEKTMKENLEYLKNKKLNYDILINHVSILYDRDLKEKIELLISAGKEMLDIYLNPSVLVKYDLKKLQAAISSLVANGMDPKDVPLMAY